MKLIRMFLDGTQLATGDLCSCSSDITALLLVLLVLAQAFLEKRLYVVISPPTNVPTIWIFKLEQQCLTRVIHPFLRRFRKNRLHFPPLYHFWSSILICFWYYKYHLELLGTRSTIWNCFGTRSTIWNCFGTRSTSLTRHVILPLMVIASVIGLNFYQISMS